MVGVVGVHCDKTCDDVGDAVDHLVIVRAPRGLVAGGRGVRTHQGRPSFPPGNLDSDKPFRTIPVYV